MSNGTTPFRLRTLLRAATAAIALFAVLGAATASAATPPPMSHGQWKQDISKLQTPATGCYSASFPTVSWHKTACVKAPDIPFAPHLATATPEAAPNVGNGFDYDAAAPAASTITQSTGTFSNASTNDTETGTDPYDGATESNVFTLQMNANTFNGAPECTSAPTPGECMGWEQFIYEGGDIYDGQPAGNQVFIQYWLLNYDDAGNGEACPATSPFQGESWMTDDDGDCYINSYSTNFTGSPVTAAQLGSTSLTSSATANGNDQVTFSVGGANASAVTEPDSVVDLAPHWTQSEWNIVGDGNATEANFSSGTTLDPTQTLATTAGNTTVPGCDGPNNGGFTGETNNLYLQPTPALGPVNAPTVEFDQGSTSSNTYNCSESAPQASSTTLTASPSSSTTNQAVTLTAKVTAASNTPTGTVEFENGGTAIAGCGAVTVTASGATGTATCATQFAAVGSPDSLSAVYTPAATAGVEASTGTASQTVGQAATSTALSVSGTEVAGEPITYTAAVTPGTTGNTAPTGGIEFFDGGSAIGSCTNQALSGATATCAVTYPTTGSHSITAEYLGDGNFQSSTSSPQAVTIANAAPTAAITAPSGVVAGTSVTFTGTGTAGTGGATITGYAWNFGDGGTSTSQNPAYTYAQAGTYTVTETVTQSDGQTSTTTSVVTVASPVQLKILSVTVAKNGNVTMKVQAPNAGSLIGMATAWKNDNPVPLAKVETVTGAPVLEPAAHRFAWSRIAATKISSGVYTMKFTPDAQAKALIKAIKVRKIPLRIWAGFTPPGATGVIEGVEGVNVGTSDTHPKQVLGTSATQF